MTFAQCFSGKGGALSASENSIFFIKNANFIKNYAENGALMHLIQNFETTSTILSSNIINNDCNENLFDLTDSTLEIIDSRFSNNVNIIFGLLRSNLTMNSSNINSHLCRSHVIGCLIKTQLSNINGSKLKISEISNLIEEGGIYLYESNAVFKIIDFSNFSNSNHQGSCFNLKSSILIVDSGNFSIYDSNCILGLKSKIEITNSIFNNEKFIVKNKKYYLYGSILCFSCLDILISNSIFLKNNESSYGGSVYLESSETLDSSAKFVNVKFIQNKALEEGGGVFIKNVMVIFINCSFIGNIAKRGASIIFFSSSKIF